MPRFKAQRVLHRLQKTSSGLEELMGGATGGERAIRFFERCLTHTKGRNYGKKPFLLPPWQRTIISDIFGTLREDGLRQYSTAYIEVPKKNGKSELAAGMALYGLLMDGEPGCEIYSAAATRDQASLVFKVAAQMVRQNPLLKARCHIVDSRKMIHLKDDPGSFYHAISADAGAQDGINPSMVVFDELHRQKNRDLHSVLHYGMATRSQPLLVEITTAGVPGDSPLCWSEHEYARQILEGTLEDPSFYPVIYALDAEEDWTFEGEPASGDKAATGWYKANPALGDFVRLDKMREECKQAQSVISAQNEFRRFRLNQWLQSESRWISVADWDRQPELNTEELKGQPCWLGLDIGSTQDLSALVACFQHEDATFSLLPTFWVPGDDLRERSKRDRVTYDVWAKQGFVRTVPGSTLEFGVVEEEIRRLRTLYDVRELIYDPWSARQLAERAEIEGLVAVKFPQTIANFSEPCKAFEGAVITGKIRHGNHPVLRWNVDSCSIYFDCNGNIRPTKPDRAKDRKRIDGLVASLMAFSRARLSIDVDPMEFLRDPIFV
jgi:phage terminase large subunit-like protein